MYGFDFRFVYFHAFACDVVTMKYDFFQASLISFRVMFLFALRSRVAGKLSWLSSPASASVEPQATTMISPTMLKTPFRSPRLHQSCAEIFLWTL